MAKAKPDALTRVQVLVQRAADQLFFQADDAWVKSKAEAFQFSNCTPAINFCVERGLRDVRLWLSFDDPQYDFAMDVFRTETQILVKHRTPREREVLA